MISFISNTSAGSGSSAVSQAQTQSIDQLFKKADSNQDGKITKDELTQAFGEDSVQIGSNSQPGDDGIYKLLAADLKDKGYITKQDVAQALDRAQQTGASESGTAQGAGKPAGGGGGGGGTTVTGTDPADTNQDGKVSMAEKLAYLLKQQAAQSSSAQSQVSIYG